MTEYYPHQFTTWQQGKWIYDNHTFGKPLTWAEYYATFDTDSIILKIFNGGK